MGTSWSTLTVSAETSPTILEVFKNRLYALNFGGSLANRFRFSDLADGTTFDSSNYVDTIDLPLTAARATLNYLFIFTRESLWRWDESYLFKVDNLGTRAINSPQFGNGLLYYANEQGVFRVGSSGKSEPIHTPVQKWIDGIIPSNLSKLNATFFQDEYYLWIGDCNGYTDVVLVFNTVFKSWRVLSGWPSSCMAAWTDSLFSTQLYFGQHTTSKVYRHGGTVDQNNVATSAIHKTPVLTPVGGDKEFQGKSLHCFARSSGLVTFQIKYALDWREDFVTLKEWELKGTGSTEHIRIDVPSSLNGKAIQWQITESTSGIPWTWEGLRFYYDIARGVDD